MCLENAKKNCHTARTRSGLLRVYPTGVKFCQHCTREPYPIATPLYYHNLLYYIRLKGSSFFNDVKAASVIILCHTRTNKVNRMIRTTVDSYLLNLNKWDF